MKRRAAFDLIVVQPNLFSEQLPVDVRCSRQRVHLLGKLGY